MGLMKDLWQHQMEAGYSHMPGEKYVCTGCISDPHLREDIEGELDEDGRCTYCGSSPATDLTVVLDSVAEYLHTEYADPVHELPYESREGGYQGVVYQSDEVLDELGEWTESDGLLADVAEAFAGSAWCQKHYFSLKEDEKLQSGWESFVTQVKHRTRYLFLQELGDEDDAFREGIPPGRMLEALGSVTSRFDLFTTLPASTEIIRARVHDRDKEPSTAEELGAPPRDGAVRSNRMSPAGIPMFYGALDEMTAALETFDPSLSDDKVITLATFSSDRDLVLLDLTELPSFPSPFDRERRDLRRPLSFLHDFVYDLTRPIVRDGREHVEYVPTQVVTEFIRHRFSGPDDRPLDGILYRSSRPGAGTAVVLFLEPEQCGPRADPGILPPPQVLTLKGYRTLEPADLGLTAEAE